MKIVRSIDASGCVEYYRGQTNLGYVRKAYGGESGWNVWLPNAPGQRSRRRITISELSDANNYLDAIVANQHGDDWVLR